jgi:MFS transporter, FSR family, fosmidomycin resistance protein
MYNKHTQPLLWGLLHGLNDFAAGYMLANYTFRHEYSQSFLLIIVYSIIAFGGQLPVGFWLDAKKKITPFARVSFALLALAVPAYFAGAGVGIIVSAFASAFVHVTGGAVCLQVHAQKTGPLALFTAPGVLGLTLGGAIGAAGTWVLLVALVLIVVIAALVFAAGLPAYQSPEKKESELDVHDWLMLGILLVMCFRSFLFDVVNHVAHDYKNGILIIGISAFAGKIIGGFLADKIGWKKYVYISLPLALLLFQFGKDNIVALGFGIACLQSSVPITLLLMARSLPLYPATATGLSLGTSVALAGLPLYLVSSKSVIIGWFGNGWVSISFFILLLLCGWFIVRSISRMPTKAIAE